MSLKSSLLFSLFFSFFLLLSSTNAFNITKILGQYPGFSTFNNLLTQTQLAGAINSRQSITVLAVDNGNIPQISSQSTDTLKKILSVHVILDYFDVPKLQKLQNKTAILTTLLQSSGQATGLQGFLNVTDLSTGGVAFGSAIPGSSLGSNLVKSVASQPYNISVLQVSNVIMPPGIGGSWSNSSTSPPSPSPASTPSKSPTPAATPAKSPVSKAPAPSAATPDPSYATPPSNANAPSDANAPTADSPVGSPPMPAGGPVADDPVADAPAGDSSGAPEKFGVNLAVFVMVISSTWSLALVM